MGFRGWEMKRLESAPQIGETFFVPFSASVKKMVVQSVRENPSCAILLDDQGSRHVECFFNLYKTERDCLQAMEEHFEFCLTMVRKSIEGLPTEAQS